MYYKLLSSIIILIFSSLAIMSQSVDEILDKSIEASGGVKAFENVKTTYSVIKMEVMGMEMKMKLYTKAPDKSRVEQSVMGQEIVVVFDGEKGWMNNPMAGGVTEVPVDQIDQIKRQNSSNSSNLWDWRKREGVTIEKIGKVRLDGASVYHLKVTEKDGTESNIYLDANTYLMTKLTMPSEAGDVEIKFLDYKDYDGFKMASRFVTEAMGMEVIATMEEYKINIPVDDSLFAKPE